MPRFAGEAGSIVRDAPPTSSDPVVAATYAREQAVREKFVGVETAKARAHAPLARGGGCARSWGQRVMR